MKNRTLPPLHYDWAAEKARILIKVCTRKTPGESWDFIENSIGVAIRDGIEFGVHAAAQSIRDGARNIAKDVVIDSIADALCKVRSEAIEEAAKYIDDYSTILGDEIRALKGGKP